MDAVKPADAPPASSHGMNRESRSHHANPSLHRLLFQLDRSIDATYVRAGSSHVQSDAFGDRERLGIGLDGNRSSGRSRENAVLASIQVRRNKPASAGENSEVGIMFQAKLLGHLIQVLLDNGG